MKISELKARQGNIELTAEIASISAPRDVSTPTGKGKVATAKIKDASGQVTLTLWNEQVDQVHIGDKIKITKGYVSEFRGEIQLSTGKFGTLEVLELQKGIIGAVGEHAAAQATPDELEEAEVLGAELDQPSVDEALTGDEAIEHEIKQELPETVKKTPHNDQNTSLDIEEEDVADE